MREGGGGGGGGERERDRVSESALEEWRDSLPSWRESII